MGSQLALVTGASSGIGLELARQFAEHDFDLIVVAEDDGIHTRAAELRATGVAVVALQADLATAAGVDDLVAQVGSAGRPLDVLALNAGVGVAGPFLDTALDDDLRLIELNITGVVRTTKLLLPSLTQRGAGRVLITSSVAALMPGPFYATYAASKSFLLSFAEAIRHELRDSGVTVTALMPGPTDTNFFERAGMQDTPVWDADKDDPADVARDAFDALMAGDDHVVAGTWKNKLQAVGTHLMSQPMQAAAHARLTTPTDA